MPAHLFLLPYYHPPLLNSNSFPFFHPTAIPPWPHHPLFTTSSFPTQPKQASAIQESQHLRQLASRAQICPEPTLQAQHRGWQQLHAAAAGLVLVSKLGAGNTV